MPRLPFAAAELRRLDQAVEQGGHVGPSPGPGTVVIFPTEDYASQATLGQIVIEGNARSSRKRVSSVSLRPGSPRPLYPDLALVLWTPHTIRWEVSHEWNSTSVYARV